MSQRMNKGRKEEGIERGKKGRNEVMYELMK